VKLKCFNRILISCHFLVYILFYAQCLYLRNERFYSIKVTALLNGNYCQTHT